MTEENNVTWGKLYLAVRISTAIEQSPMSKQMIAEHFTIPSKRLDSWETTGDIREQDVKELASLTHKPMSWFCEPLTAYGDKVHVVRLLLRLSRNEFANRIGITLETVERLETHQTTSVNSATLHKISELASIPSSWFMNAEATPPAIKTIAPSEGLAYQQRKAADLFSKLNNENRVLILTMLEKLAISESVEN